MQMLNPWNLSGQNSHRRDGGSARAQCRRSTQPASRSGQLFVACDPPTPTHGMSANGCNPIHHREQQCGPLQLAKGDTAAEFMSRLCVSMCRSAFCLDDCPGSLALITARSRDVRFTPESGHVRCDLRCRLWANSGHWPKQRDRLAAVSPKRPFRRF